MKAWTVSELNNVMMSLRPLAGLRLQEVLTLENDLVLGFYSPGGEGADNKEGLLWLWIDLNAIAPSILPWGRLPFLFKSKKTPLNLFLRAHFVDRRFLEVQTSEESDRIVRLVFQARPESGELIIEVRVFPHGRNVIAVAGGKQVAWQKPEPLVLGGRQSKSSGKTNESMGEMTEPHSFHQSTNQRALDDLRNEWLARRQVAGSKKSSNDPRMKMAADLQKKEKALAKVEEELRRKHELPWKTIGEWLKAKQTLDVPKEWEPFVDRRRKLSWNIEQCFTRAREVEGKLRGTEERLAFLKQQVETARVKLASPDAVAAVAVVEKHSTAPKLDAQGRSLKLRDEVFVMAGKSAADNLKILRKARAWDLWFHLRDYPSSHAVLFRNKNTSISDAEIRKVGEWFLSNHFGSKATQHKGERFDVIYTECRFVRPIKGDKIGRVNFHDEKTIRCEVR